MQVHGQAIAPGRGGRVGAGRGGRVGCGHGEVLADSGCHK
ncbi:hypothetical protein CDS [Bradyrhizobium sp.]|nr:hypothetical protein CDS [Bradyrhizobium sp.]CUU22230.1 hypothetical protein CDS [Bradyrhizobium sp.]